MNEIEFCERDTNTVKTNIISVYEGLAQRSLAKADPVRLFLEAIADVIIQQREIIDNAAKMNLLYYSIDNYLDHIGYLVGCTRTAAAKATTNISITLSAVRSKAITIPAGTRVAGDDGKIVFAIDSNVTILAGSTSAEVSATAVDVGVSYNDFAPGEINKIVDPIAYVGTMVNTTKTEGGADVESDDEYRERIRLAPESFSTAGPKGAYEYWVKTASSLIADVSVTSPTAGEVVIYPLLENGEIPGEEIFKAIQNVLNDDVRPLTDKIVVKAPIEVNYNIALTYYIDTENKTSELSIRNKVSEAVNRYIKWQKARMGRDVNPSTLISYIIGAGAKRVEITEPAFSRVAQNAVAIASAVNVAYGGLEDG